MPPRILWCRWDGCGEAYRSVTAEVPAFCPVCQRPGRWSVIPGNRIVPDYADPKPAYDLSINDRRLLKALRIDPEVTA